VLVRRLTCIKLPAALREGVYRERPCHEQAEWLTRIRGWADPEAEVSALATEVRVPSWARRRERLRRPAHQMLIRLGLARPYVHTSALDRWQERRRFKGLED
jgi:hypothetical protein